MEEELKRRSVIAEALSWTKGTSREAEPYEEWLLEQYCCSRLSIDQVIEFLDGPTPEFYSTGSS
jgi:hypothetical protein